MPENRIEPEQSLGEAIADALLDLGKRIKRGDPILVTKITLQPDGSVWVREGLVVFGNEG